MLKTVFQIKFGIKERCRFVKVAGMRRKELPRVVESAIDGNNDPAARQDKVWVISNDHDCSRCPDDLICYTLAGCDEVIKGRTCP